MTETAAIEIARKTLGIKAPTVQAYPARAGGFDVYFWRRGEDPDGDEPCARAEVSAAGRVALVL